MERRAFLCCGHLGGGAGEFRRSGRLGMLTSTCRHSAIFYDQRLQRRRLLRLSPAWATIKSASQAKGEGATLGLKSRGIRRMSDEDRPEL